MLGGVPDGCCALIRTTFSPGDSGGPVLVMDGRHAAALGIVRGFLPHLGAPLFVERLNRNLRLAAVELERKLSLRTPTG